MAEYRQDVRAPVRLLRRFRRWWLVKRGKLIVGEWRGWAWCEDCDASFDGPTVEARAWLEAHRRETGHRG